MNEIINQIFKIREKCSKSEITSLDRSLDRIYFELDQMGYQIIDPLGKIYKNEMTDLDARINGELTDVSKVTKVLKPVIYKKNDEGTLKLIQQGIVIID